MEENRRLLRHVQAESGEYLSVCKKRLVTSASELTVLSQPVGAGETDNRAMAL